MKIDLAKAQQVVGGLLKIAGTAGVPFAGIVGAVLEAAVKGGASVKEAVGVLRENGVDEAEYRKVLDDARTFKDFHS